MVWQSAVLAMCRKRTHTQRRPYSRKSTDGREKATKSCDTFIRSICIFTINGARTGVREAHTLDSGTLKMSHSAVVCGRNACCRVSRRRHMSRCFDGIALVLHYRLSRQFFVVVVFFYFRFLYRCSDAPCRSVAAAGGGGTANWNACTRCSVCCLPLS